MSFYEYQALGAHWLTHRKFALLADEMGLGKSAQAISAADTLHSQKTLIVCPASVEENWAREFDRFSKRNVRPTIVSYDMLVRHLSRFQKEWDVLILDESQYLKNPEAKRTRAVFGKSGVARKAGRVWCLSGTPAPNHAAELWVLLFSFGCTKLTYSQFVDYFCDTRVVIQDRVQILGTRGDRISEIRNLLSPIMLRRTKREVLPELPPLTYADVYVNPMDISYPNEIKARFERELNHVLEILGYDLERPERAQDILLMLEGMAQSVSTLRRYLGVQKAMAHAPQVEQELKDGAYGKIILFAIHKECVEILKTQLAHFNPAVITGETSRRKRQYEVDRFQNEPSCRVFIGNIQAAGTGITLTAGANVDFIEQDWVPGNNAQAAMRAHRIGQLSNVLVRFVSIRDSLDQKITAVLSRKTAEIARFLDIECN